MSVHTTACPRNCYSTCAMRVTVSGSPNSLWVFWLSSPMASSVARRLAVVPYCQWALGPPTDGQHLHVVTRYDAARGMVTSSAMRAPLRSSTSRSTMIATTTKAANAAHIHHVPMLSILRPFQQSLRHAGQRQH